MSALERVLPTPALREVDVIELAVPLARAWELLRHGDFGSSPLVRALFALRTIPERLGGRQAPELELRVDGMKSSVDHPGFQILVDDVGQEVVVGAIGKVWHLEIPFAHVADADAFKAFSERGFVKVAWAIRLSAMGEHNTQVIIELRVDATDSDSWSKFRRYFTVIGPGSRFIRRSILSSLARKYGTPDSNEEQRSLPGDELLCDAGAQITHAVTIAATPAAIWPWLVQMGCGRAGFYAVDAVDNGGVRSAREIHPELQRLRIGDIIPATRNGDDGFEVLAIDRERALVLGGLHDADAKRQRAFATHRPEHFWHITWSFSLEPIGPTTTRLHVRARAAFPASGRVQAMWIKPIHHFMEAAQLRHLAARIERTVPVDDFRDVASGIGGAGVMAAAFLTPFLRGARNHWGIDAALASRTYPGDELIAEAAWSWTHGIEIDAPTSDVWPWIAQLGADRGGFYSYQWLENVAGCGLQNAEAIHPEWAVREGDDLVLHPKMPALRVVALEPGRFFVVHAPADAAARAAGKPWAQLTWLFFVEAIGEDKTRLVSRYRCATSDDFQSHVQFGPVFLEPIGFAMDRRMLLGVKARVESRRHKPSLRSFARRRQGTPRAPKGP